MADSEVTDLGVEAVARRRLRMLSLESERVTDGGLERLAAGSGQTLAGGSVQGAAAPKPPEEHTRRRPHAHDDTHEGRVDDA